MRQHAKFCADRPSRCIDMAVFSIFQAGGFCCTPACTTHEVVVYSAPGSRPMIKTYKIVKVNNKNYNNTRSVHTCIQQFAPFK